MPFDGITTFNLIKELKSQFIGGKINKIYQPEKDEINLIITNNKNKYNLLLSANNNFPRIYITKFNKENPTSPYMFCMILRKNIKNGKIIDIKQVSFDRIIEIYFETKNEIGDFSNKKLVLEIMGRHSNIILVNCSDNKIIDSVKRINKNISSFREVLPGKEYILPPNKDKLNPLEINKETFRNLLNNFSEKKKIEKFFTNSFLGFSPLISREILFLSGISEESVLANLNEKQKKYLLESFIEIINKIKSDVILTLYSNETVTLIYDFSTINIKYYKKHKKVHFNSVSELLENYYYLKDKLGRIKVRSSSLLHLIQTKLNRNYKKLDKLFYELKQSKDNDKYKLFGELITSNIYTISKGMKSVKLQNYYSNNELIEIALDERLSPSKNAQYYYKKYNKSKNALEQIKHQIEITENEIFYLEGQIDNLNKCTEINELLEIKDELSKEGYLNKKINKNKNKNKKNQPSTPMHFISLDNFHIFVGKNNKQNDYLTLKFAKKEDIWLHTKDIPGSHVIISSQGKDVPLSTIREASILAAYFSKAKNSSKVPVDYTFVKYVKKPKTAKTGMVIYTNQNTIYTTPNQDEFFNIKRAESHN